MIGRVALLLLLTGAGPPEYGELRIVSQPGTAVVWEGVELGAVGASGEMVITDVPLGRYRIAVRKSGFRTRSSEVEIGPGSSTVRWELEPMPASETTAEVGLGRAAGEAPVGPGAAARDAAVAPSTGAAVTEQVPRARAVTDRSPTRDTRDVDRRLVAGGALAILGALLVWWLRRRERPTPRSRRRRSRTRAVDSDTDAASNLPQPMLEKLRQHEAAIEGGDGTPASSPSTPVIDVVDFEVIEEET